MTNDIRKSINAVNGKTKLAEASTTLGNVTVTADDTMLRILDLAGIARPAGVDQPAATDMDHMTGDANLPVPMDDLGGMQIPAEMPSTVDPVPGLGDTMDAGADLGSEIDADTDPAMISQDGDDSVFEPVDPDLDDSGDMEIDFEVDPATKTESSIEEAEKQAPAKRYDHGNLDANMGQQTYRMDAHNFSGNAKKPVRFVPARSGDNPLVDPKKTLKAYMEDIETEKKELNEDNTTSELMAKTLKSVKSPSDQQKVAKAISDLEKTQSFKDENPGEKIRAAVGTLDNPALTRAVDTELKSDQATQDTLQKLTDEDLEERRRNYSFKQTIMPFQGLTGAQRISRAATKAAKRRLG